MALKEKTVVPKYLGMKKKTSAHEKNCLFPLKLTPSHAKLTEMSVREENF
jgi:hypothetical protein